MLRIAHCSDIHLDADEHAAEHYKQGFANTLRAISRFKPDLVLLAGDLFDANNAHDDTIRWAMQTLAEQPWPIVMIPGNHDCLAENAIYHRYDFNALQNVDLLMAESGELRYIESLQVALWGKGMVDHSPKHRPLADCPPRPAGARWYLGLGHGIYVPEGAATDRSSPVHEQEIGASDCDYIALGHHHAALVVHNHQTAAAYCGSPTDEVGGAATYALIELEQGRFPSVEIKMLGDDD